MSAIDDLFRRLRSAGKKAFMPFVTAGDPDLDFTAAVLMELAASGASLCELGIPYSDPIADGPVIQASYTRALGRNVRLDEILQMTRVTAPRLTTPLVTMVSYAIVHRHGPERYVDEALAAGVAGAIVPDLLVEESGSFAEICRCRDFSLIQLVTPTTPRERALRIAEASTGFLYYVSVTGITGERRELPPDLVESVAWLRQRTPLPICIGFGIGTAEHAKLLAPVADGLIVGSALVRRIAEVERQGRAEVLAQVRSFAAELVQAIEESSNP